VKYSRRGIFGGKKDSEGDEWYYEMRRGIRDITFPISGFS